ncbi:transcription factor RFX4-like isoform X2 [Acanthaster planci]|uniref:Transcription factor RFX4-like isoform X2 n=1 Tax=Acanthaster planci TaxID=133434 RepID=A0A8B7Y6J7_ACAPL|nr:transcription factor RFX4-like isoform X2 [Acanthaster planci]
MGDAEISMDPGLPSNVTNPTTSKQVSPAKKDSAPHQKDYIVVDLESQDTTHRLQTILTLHWLSQHYESVEGVSLPRCLIYKHYSDYCQKHQFHPINAASFGKVIRQVFPELRTRRLGTRGQSKYHYHGIRVKESSPYFGVFLDSQRITTPAFYRTPGIPLLSSKAQWESSLLQSQTDNLPSPMTSMLTLLPEFPTAAQTQPWGDLEFDQVDGVIAQYRCHCQQVIEYVLQGKLEEVPVTVHQYWRSLPDETKQVLSSSNKLADLIGLCDNILYQTLVNILIPGTVQQLPPSLLHAIRHFSCGFQKIIEESLPTLTEYFHLKQVQTVKRFCQLLKRKTSLSHLAQATRAVLKTRVTVTQMSHDWRKRTEQNTVCAQLMWTAPGSSAAIKAAVKKCFAEFSRLLEKHASVEEHIKWLDTVRRKCLKSTGEGDLDKTEEAERDFLLQWSYVCNLLIRDQTLRSATSFGSFHLLHLLYEEYLLYVVDVQQNQKQERALWKRLFDNDTDVPSYFLTSADTSDLDSAKCLPDVKAKHLHRLPPHINTSFSNRVPSSLMLGVSANVGQDPLHPCATSTGKVFAKPSVATAAGSPRLSATLSSSTGEASSNAAYSLPASSTSVPVSGTPSKTPQGNLGRSITSTITPTQRLTSSPQIPARVKEETAASGTLFGGSPSLLTIPLGGSVAILQTSPSRGGSTGAVTVLPSGFGVSPSPVALAVPHAVSQQQFTAVNSTLVPAQAGSHSREPPPLQPITPSHQSSPGSLNPISLPKEIRQSQQNVVASKIVKILTATNGDRYLINEVQSTVPADTSQKTH